MIYRLVLGGQCIATYKALRSAKAAYDLVEFALRVAKVDFSTIDFNLTLVKEN